MIEAPRDPLAIARELGDKGEVNRILDERASSGDPIDAYDYFLARQGRARRRTLGERFARSSFRKGLTIGFFTGQLLLLALALIIGRVAHG